MIEMQFKEQSKMKQNFDETQNTASLKVRQENR